MIADVDSSDMSSSSWGGSVLTEMLVFKLLVDEVVREVMFAGAPVSGASMLLLEVTD